MISPARWFCYEALLQVELQGVFSDDALNSAEISALDPRDRNLVTEILYGSLRWQGWLDHLLGMYSSRPWGAVDPEVKILLRMSLYQLVFLSRTPTFAVVNEAVNLIKRRRPGLDKFVNGVLRNIARGRPWEEESDGKQCPDWVRVSLPPWIWERWKNRFGKSAARSFALSLNAPPMHSFWLAEGAAPPEWKSSLPGAVRASDLVPGCYLSPLSLPHLPAGADIHEQDEASQLIPHLLGDVTGKRVWDACAAPGGKSRILRGLVGPGGHVTASDLREKRIKHLRDFLDRDAGGGYSVLVADASQCPPYLRRFDAVLADVPCTGLGTLRRNPEIKWRMQESRLPRFQGLQSEILGKVAGAVKTGGGLLYSTCSTEPEENEDVVHRFLESNPAFVLRRPEALPGIDPWIGKDDMFRSFPGNRLWDGFFAALMVRKC